MCQLLWHTLCQSLPLTATLEPLVLRFDIGTLVLVSEPYTTEPDLSDISCYHPRLT